MKRFRTLFAGLGVAWVILPIATLASLHRQAPMTFALLTLFLFPHPSYFFGIATASLLYYFLLLPLVGLWPVLGAAAGLLFLVFRGHERPPLPKKPEAFAFALGLSSFLLAGLMAANLHRLYGNVIYHFAATLVVFFFGAGTGQWASRRLEKNAYAFPFLQVLKAILGASGVFVVMEIAASHDGVAALFTHFLFAFLLGFVAGNEVARVACRLSYGAGAVVAAIALPFVSHWNPTATLVPAVMTLALLLWLTYRAKDLEVPARIGIYLVLGAIAARFLYLIPTFDPSELDQRYYSVSPNSELVFSLSSRRQKFVAVVTPADDVEPEDEQFPEFEEAVRLMSGEKTRDRWLSLYRDSTMQVFSPLGAETDFFHHAFVHPTMLTARSRKKILILGGGDGLAAKEVLKYDEVESVTVSDEDPKLIAAVKTNLTLLDHSAGSLNHPKVKIGGHENQQYDVILIDSMDSTDFPFFRQYTLGFLEEAKGLLAEGGSLAMAIDNFDRPGFWNIVHTAFVAGWKVVPHHSLDPSGFEGLVILSHEPKDMEAYAAAMFARPFVIPDLLLTPQALEYYARPEIAEARSQDYPVNTASRPTFLRYYPGALPWAAPGGQLPNSPE